MTHERPDNIRRQLLADALAGCSLVNLLYVEVWRLLFAAKSYDAFYLTVTPLHYVAAIVAVLVGGVLGALVGQFMRRSPRPVQYPLRIAFLATALIAIGQMRRSGEIAVVAVVQHPMPMLHALEEPGLALVALVIVALVIRFTFPLSRAYRVLLLVLSPFVVFTVVRAAWTMATLDFAQFRDLPRATHAGVATPSRVVIVVLDELDYENLYAKRPKDLSLPNLDALRVTAVSFDSVLTPGANTLESLPSYLLQRHVERLDTTGPRSFVAQLSGGDSLRSDTARSIFALPAALGARIAVIGFALPYCRLDFAAAADLCDWMPFGNGVSSSADGDGFWQIALRQVQSLHPYDSRRSHIRRLERLLHKSVQFASDSSLSVVFLHIALPHMPATWDRKANAFNDHMAGADGYFDNLALADRFVGRLREGMIQGGTWSKSTFVVMSDHAERTKLWDKRSTDQRVPLFVKLPGMEAGTRVSDPVNSLFVTSLLPDLLRGRIPDAATLRSRALDYVRSDPSLLLPPTY